MGKLSHKQQLEKSLKIVDSIFNEARSGHWSFGKKNGLSDSAYDGYEGTIKNILRLVYEENKTGDLFKVKLDQVESVIKGMSNVSSAKQAIAAVNFFQKAMEKSNAVRKPPEMARFVEVDKEQTLNRLSVKFKAEGRVRHAAETTVLKATDQDTGKVLEKIDDSKSGFKQQAREAIELGSLLGTRIHEALKMKTTDVNFRLDGSAEVYIKGKGGLERYVETDDQSTVNYLRVLVAKAPKGSTLIKPLTHENGRKFSNRDAAVELGRVIRTAAKQASVNRVVEVNGKSIQKSYTSHAARKNYAGNRVEKYKKMNESDLRKEVDRRITADQARFGDSSKLEKKWNTLRRRINEGAKGEKRTKEWREPNKKEMVFFLASHDIGHTRVDVIRFYAEYEQSKDNNE